MVLVVDSISALKKEPASKAVLDLISSKKHLFESLSSVPEETLGQLAFDNRKGVAAISRAISHVFDSQRSLSAVGLSPKRTSFLSQFCGPDGFSQDVSRFSRLNFESVRARLVRDFAIGEKTEDQLAVLSARLKITIEKPQIINQSGVRFTNCRSEIVEFSDAVAEANELESKFRNISLRLLHIEGILLSDELFGL